MTLEQWLQVGQALLVLLLWLFYIGRWVGKHDNHHHVSRPQDDIIPVCRNIFEDQETSLKQRFKEEHRTRDRLHNLEHFQSSCEARLKYVENEIDRLRGSAPIKH